MSDRITLYVASGKNGDEALADVLARHGEWIRAEVLATALVVVEALTDTYQATAALELDELPVQLALTKAG